MSLCQLTSFPSLAHYSLAQTSATSSGRGFLGLRTTTSTLTPKTSPLPTSPGIRLRPTGEKGTQGARAPTPTEQPDAIFVWNFGAVYFGFEHQTFGVEEQMALCAFDLLGGVEAAALCASHSRGPGRV